MPNSKKFDDFVAENFVGYALRVGASCQRLQEFSLGHLKAMAEEEQITTHFCIQVWSGVAEWGGDPRREILELVQTDEGGALRGVLFPRRRSRRRALLRRPQDRKHATN